MISSKRKFFSSNTNTEDTKPNVPAEQERQNTLGMAGYRGTVFPPPPPFIPAPVLPTPGPEAAPTPGPGTTPTPTPTPMSLSLPSQPDAPVAGNSVPSMGYTD